MYLKHLEELDEDKRRQTCATMFNAMFAIAEQLHGLDDNHRVTIKEIDDDDPSPDWYGRLVCLKWLAEQIKAIDYIPVSIGSQEDDGYSVSVINRYVFEDAMRELSQLQAKLIDYEGYDKSIDDKITPNMVYYDTITGKGLVNGKWVNLTGRNKSLFKELFLAAPYSIPDSTFVKIAKSYGHDELGDKYARNDAISALRKACKKADNSVIVQIGGARLNALTFPLSAQLPATAYNPKG